MFGRIASAVITALFAASCAAGTPSPETQTSNLAQANGLPPDLAALVAQPQTGSFNPEAAKDAEFFEDTPEQFRPFIAVCNAWDEWDKPAPPFKIHGNTYYVGTCGIASILIEQGAGQLVLIDTGTQAGADVIIENIRTLGFDTKDIGLLLSSHEHYDHAGGMARMMAVTGADLLGSPIQIKVMSSGKDHPEDPQFGMHPTMQPTNRGNSIYETRAIQLLEAMAITPVETPGHTPGAMTWQWESCEGDDCKTIVYADSLSPVSADSYKFSDHPEYLAAFHEGIERLARLDCDILLTPHPSHSQMLKRMRTDTLVQPDACAYYATSKANDMERRLEREAGGDQ